MHECMHLGQLFWRQSIPLISIAKNKSVIGRVTSCRAFATPLCYTTNNYSYFSLCWPCLSRGSHLAATWWPRDGPCGRQLPRDWVTWPCHVTLTWPAPSEWSDFKLTIANLQISTHEKLAIEGHWLATLIPNNELISRQKLLHPCTWNMMVSITYGAKKLGYGPIWIFWMSHERGRACCVIGS